MSTVDTDKAATVRISADGLAVITIDVPGESVNTLNPRFAADFENIITKLERDRTVRAAVIASGKKDGFIAGADVKVLAAVTTAAQAAELSRNGQKAMQRIADLPFPVVAAIHGACLGGGLELALACTARVAADDKKTKLGLPEVQLGLLPGAGGTQRLPKLIGLQAAMDLILTGKQINGKRAKKLGLVDEIAPRAILLRAASELALSLADRPAEQIGPVGRMTQAVRSLFSPDELSEFVLEDNPLGRKVLFDTARKKLRQKTRGNYPAPEKALEAIRIGASDTAAGYEAEARLFGELVVSPEAASLMSIFFATTALKKDTGVDDAAIAPRPVESIGMIGAGLMGAGIAYVTAAVAKTPVRLKDRDAAGVGKGLAYARGIFDERVAKKRLTKRERDDLMTLISATTGDEGFKKIPVVIEAVFEDLELKHKILRHTEALGGPEVIFASNTSTLPITRIAEASSHPETVIGMHYFSPVHKMPLLEVITTDKTAPWVTATCVELGKRQGKTVIVVRDGVGFYTSRILGPYMNEAFHILAEGVPVEAIDEALLDFGFPVGPVKLLDEVGIDVAHKASGVVKASFGDRIDSPDGMEALIADERYGRKNGRGFYSYQDGKSVGVDATVYDVLGIAPKASMPARDIAMRCALQMANEAAHCLGEGILRSPRDGDIGAIFGLGFPPFLGGPFRWMDSMGINKIVSELRALESTHGRRFAPAPRLVEMAASGARFYAAAIPPQADEPSPSNQPRA